MIECDMCGNYFDPEDMQTCCSLDLCEVCYLAHYIKEHS